MEPAPPITADGLARRSLVHSLARELRAAVRAAPAPRADRVLVVVVCPNDGCTSCAPEITPRTRTEVLAALDPRDDLAVALRAANMTVDPWIVVHGFGGRTGGPPSSFGLDLDATDAAPN